MTKNLQLLYLLVVLNGCCAFTSQDCGCVPPNPELSSEALSWIDPYQILPYFIFENEIGILDTLAIQIKIDTEYCGGDECGSNCEVEKAILSSPINHELEFSISAKEQNHIVINNYEQTDSLIFAELDLVNQKTYVFNENTSATLDQNYEWSNQSLTVLKIDCNDPLDCTKYAIQKMIISQEKGLIEYELISGEKWKKIN